MIKVKYFASLKTMAGKEEDRFDLGRETTVLKLSEAIGKTSPAIGEMVREKKVMVSVNQDVVLPDAVIHDGDEVALLPPFSGGAI
ncbi:MAG: MoaD/ThiS family protein [Nitrospinae bacterium]|nr:MoaD/ThiS family protein [Nitrospinota bacterium]